MHSPRTTRKRTEPAFIEPMQCKPVTALPEGEKWTFEIKFDGYRCVVVKRESEVTLFVYESGKRSGAWIKHRTNREQEFVIGGYIPGGHGFDALLVGVYENKNLIFVAKVKDGFVPRIRDEIFPTLKTFVDGATNQLVAKFAGVYAEASPDDQFALRVWMRDILLGRKAGSVNMVHARRSEKRMVEACERRILEFPLDMDAREVAKELKRQG
jgi:ATP-dependent DNA ligase